MNQAALDASEAKEAKVASPPRGAIAESLGVGAGEIQAGFDQFVLDIEPFFFRRSVVFLDVGAFEGSWLSKIQASRLDVREAHLIEPNAKSFAVLKETSERVFGKRVLNLYNVAMGAKQTRLRMRGARSATQVIEEADEAESITMENSQAFVARCWTLDDLAKLLPNRHASILAIDVAGYEENVLAGGSDLLAADGVDIVYVSVHGATANEQTSSYRRVDDAMRRHGYQLFRIYQQTSSWQDDTALLDQMSLAYLSTSFAQRNSYRVAKELMSALDENSSLKVTLADEQRRNEEARAAQIEKADARLAGAIEKRDRIIARQQERAEAIRAAAKENARTLEAVLAETEAALDALRTRSATLDTEMEAMRQQISATQDQLASARADIAVRERTVSELRTHSVALESEIVALQQQAVVEDSAHKRETEKLRAQISKLQTQIDAERRAQTAMQARLEGMEASTSWRVTAPIRSLRNAAGHLLKPARSSPVIASPARAFTPSSAIVARGANVIDSSSRAKRTTAQDRPNADASPSASVKVLEEKLWGGFSQRALTDLETLKSAPSAPRRERGKAAFALASWYAAEGDLARAYENVQTMRSDASDGRDSIARTLLEAYCLVRLERFAEARTLLGPALDKNPENLDVRLALANAFIGDDAARLAWINGAYERFGLAPVCKRDASRPLSVDNLSTPALVPAVDDSRAKVSIILPVYNGAETLEFTLEGLLAQTWRNLELIVVDDCSTDDTYAMIEKWAARDPRIVPMRQRRNEGSYSCRNLGLTIASGDFITVHDANDWSHPQKIERQARHLLDHAHCIANHSNWARVTEDLTFVGKFRRKDRIVDWNPSSFFFRRTLLDMVGAWDRVRISADAEFIRRAREARPVSQKIEAIEETAPLALAFDTAASLTKHSVTHGRTIYHGFRREYHEAATHWHSVSARRDLRLELNGHGRPFPAPGPMLADRQSKIECDLLVIADFNLAEPDTDATLRDIETAVASGTRVAVFQWRLYNQDVTEPLNVALRQLAMEAKLKIVAPGETVAANLVLVACAAALEDEIDLCPKVECAALHVLTDRGRQPEQLARAKANAAKLLGSDGVWAPGGSWQDLIRS